MTQPGQFYGQCIGRREYNDVDAWEWLVSRIADVLGERFRLDGLELIKDHFGTEIDHMQQSITLLCHGEFDVLRRAFGWYSADEVNEAIANNYKPKSVYYLGGVFTLPEDVKTSPG